ncbi:nitroreductase family deazaflavin-dependent oxidoreductase [Mycobacterium sp. CBMA293]|uniref:nitroreductase family deazaflavin-dependent oxidoreductase n=1 Tax=unclassified Mycolicibacterium TaxID=2636767 RepID=UPI0012DE6EB8|nr:MULTISPECIES: nitroreductase family deazaflavin-dependent oxidoreductase [unclassified Mycolicibacterium]MUL46547.1 nitroreductase family deazaflavin-dependent oxidoreductase [Mycolicibacterium sp. CBMA 360]MUL59154.1 nitroreductase family deazaflavin-dependent oxidoreductase [Mycolicibacterium sp. CBMA 335]MUL69548.1 nitroreductase family deazaflavin-dependent oxidoreductase [Mycolicibacterium sp. CBMA 311]MUL94512.1 nitroreductase family deazaflavin-dependent oxidoreductase [Mycolicibacter
MSTADNPPPEAVGVLAAAATGLLRSRRFTRAPIWIYRARAGAVFGSRLLMLEHVGRTSGARRYVVLEVIDHSAPDSYVVASGFGDKAQWFRNIQANPRVRVYAGSRRPATATARVLDQADADSVLGTYIGRHPRAWARFKTVLEQTLGTEISATDTPLPLVELRLGTRA